jgi:hypothetical protein
MAWNERNEALLRVLTHKVRFLTLSQIARTWWSGSGAPEASARQHLRRLAKTGYVERKELLLHPEITLLHPVFSWQPGEASPDCEVISYQCQERWSQPPRVVSVWIATRKAADLFGGFGGRILRLDHATHDLHVGTIYCHFARHDQERADAWLPEEEIAAEAGERTPDALLYDRAGNCFLAVEFGGACKAPRVEKLHAFGERYRLAYELW